MLTFKKGLTLLEVVIFLGVFSIVGLIVFPLLINTLNFYQGSVGEIDVSREARNLILTFQKESYKSKNINFITDYELLFEKYNGEKSLLFRTSPVFLNFDSSTLEGLISNIRVGSISLKGENYSVNFVASSSCRISSSTQLSSLYALSGYAWSPIIGWISFRNSSGESIIYGVCITSSTEPELRGYAYNDIFGFIVFNCQDLGSCSSSNFKVKLVNGKYLEGFAWNDSLGWFFFDGKNGKVYLAEFDSIYNLKKISRVTDKRINVKNLVFQKLNGSYKANFVLSDETGKKEVSYETAISLPFK
jgi:hypothetical protein